MGNIPMSILEGDGSHPKVIIRSHISFKKNIFWQLGHFGFSGHPTPDAVQHGHHDPKRTRSVVWYGNLKGRFGQPVAIQFFVSATH